MPKKAKEDIKSLVKKGRYTSVSDFLRKAVFKLLDEEKEKEGDLLKESKIRRFIEELS